MTPHTMTAEERRAHILKTMGEHQAAIMASRATGTWRPGLHAPVDFTAPHVQRLAGLGGVAQDTVVRDLDALVAAHELRRPFRGRRVWRIAR